LNDGRVLPSANHRRLGSRHALNVDRGQVIDMRTGAAVPSPTGVAGGGLAEGDVAPARWLWVDDLGRVLLHPGTHTGARPGPAFVLTPDGVEMP
jgi:hypothetical protein